MIVSDNEAIKRLESPMNLINRLSSSNQNSNNKRSQAMSLFGIGAGVERVRNESKIEPVKVRDVIDTMQVEQNNIEQNKNEAVLPVDDSASDLISLETSTTPASLSSADSLANALSTIITEAKDVRVPEVLNENNIKIDDILDNSEAKIKLTVAHDKALDLLHSSIDMMKMKLDDIKPDKLPSIAQAASKVVESIRKERIEINKDKGEKNVHFHFYEPQRKKITDYETISA